MAKYGEDQRLVERMLAGDEKAFEAFGERYFKALYRFVSARLGGDGELTREIVQTAVCHALARLDTFRGEASLLTWLCACCRNEMLMHFRRRKSAPVELEMNDEIELAPAFPSAPPRNPETALLRHEASHLVHIVLDALPAHYARALEWKYLDHLPVKEIAARMSLDPKAAESLLTRARQAFRAGYEGLHHG